MTTAEAQNSSTVFEALAEQIDPTRIVEAEDKLALASAIWNGAVHARPAVVVRCARTEEVQHAVMTARKLGLPLSVRGGGHDWAGRAIRTDGLVIDLSRMREVTVRDSVATVAGGATSDDVTVAAEKFGLAAATGTVGAIGLVGLTLAGGYGPFCGSFGLAADNLLSAEVVLADGRIVRADKDTNPDLFWALQGGGGNFGVVTSVDIALHPLTEILVGSFVFPFENAREVMSGYGRLVDEIPDHLTAVLSIIPGDDGTPTVMVSPTWAGTLADGYPVMDEFAALAGPLVAEISATSPLLKLRQLDGVFPNGARYALRTCNIAKLTPAVASTLLDAYAARKTAGSFINVHHFHGHASDQAIGSTAFGRRDPHLMIEAIETGEPLSDWVKDATEMLAPYALPGGYPNLLGPDEKEKSAAAYGPNARRLLDVKDRYDPHGVFRATPLPFPEDVAE